MANCLTCASNAYKDNSVCVATCPPNKYADSSRVCQPCDGSCQTCSGGANNNCLTCPGSQLLTHQNKCQATCDPGYTSNGTHCLACHTSCKTCTDTTSNGCTSCPASVYLTPIKSCVTTCPVKTIANNAAWTCDSCAPNCLTCNSANNFYDCATCESPRTLDASKYCLKPCTAAQYFDYDNDVCVNCNSLCATCTGPLVADCTACATTAFKDLGTCVALCPSNKYPDGNKDCQLCDTTCGTCNGPLATNCLSCQALNYLHPDKQCKGSCDPGTF